MGSHRRGTALPPRVELSTRSLFPVVPVGADYMGDVAAGPTGGEEVARMMGYPVEVVDGARPGEVIMHSVATMRVIIPVRGSVAKRLEEDATLRERVEAQLLAGLQDELHRMVAAYVDEQARGDGAIARGILP